MSMSDVITTEILVSGGGFAGLALGIALAQSGIRTAVVETGHFAEAQIPAFDGRVSSIAPDAKRMLTALGVWPHVAEAQSVTDIVVSGGTLTGGSSPFFLHFDEVDAGAALFDIVENRYLRAALMTVARTLPDLVLYQGARIDHADTSSAGVTARLSTGETVAARMLVAAEGRESPLRERFGIKVSGWSYAQWGLVCTVEHERPHDGAAQEYFLPSGPFAILPMTGNRSSLVWTERADLAASYLALSETDFADEVSRRFTDYLGEVKPVGARWGYPLAMQLARDYVATRFALVGDAAHVVHPIAGQGLNLGLRDVAALSEAIVDGARLGLDLGADAILDAYQRRRRIDGAMMAGMTDVLNRLFSNDSGPLRTLRETGLGAVNAITPLRRFFARAASGALGEAPPRLLAGEGL
jgi:2-octaprenyl-6-methoxyphenol hydroxylase